MSRLQTVTKSNELIQASYRLTLQEQRLVLCCLAKVDSRGEIPSKMTLTASEYADHYKLDLKNAHRELYKAAEKLWDREITFTVDHKKHHHRWVQTRVVYEKGEGRIDLLWSEYILKYISQLNSKFTTYKLKHVSSLTSIYSIRIYELLMQFNATGKRVIDVDELRELLEIQDKYPSFKNLNQHVISRAVKELNQCSDLTIEYETKKRGRNVESVLFTFKLNDQMKMDI